MTFNPFIAQFYFAEMFVFRLQTSVSTRWNDSKGHALQCHPRFHAPSATEKNHETSQYSPCPPCCACGRVANTKEKSVYCHGAICFQTCLLLICTECNCKYVRPLLTVRDSWREAICHESAPGSLCPRGCCTGPEFTLQGLSRPRPLQPVLPGVGMLSVTHPLSAEGKLLLSV